MGRKPSRIVLHAGREYRVSVVDRKHERDVEEWNKCHLLTVSTRLDRETQKAYQRILSAEGLTMYADLKAYVQDRIRQGLSNKSYSDILGSGGML